MRYLCKVLPALGLDIAVTADFYFVDTDEASAGGGSRHERDGMNKRVDAPHKVCYLLSP